MRLFASLSIALAALILSSSANSAQAIELTFAEMGWTDPGLLGIAQHIDKSDENNNAATQYDQDLADSALVFAMGHTTNGQVDTLAEWINELANSGSHEYGHNIGLKHEDGNANSLMLGDYDGVNKAFSDDDEKFVMEHANLTGAKVIWLDFLAVSPVAQSHSFRPFSDAPQLTAFGADVNDVIDAILAQMEGDFTPFHRPDAPALSFTFVLDEPDSGDYATVAFVVPEPSSLTLAIVAIAGVIVLGVASGDRRPHGRKGRR